MTDVLSIVRSVIEDGALPLHIITANVDHIFKLRRDPEFQRAYALSGLVVPDGVPLVWASRVLGCPLPERVNGTDLMIQLCAQAAEHQWKVFLLGGKVDAARRCSLELQKITPRLRVVGATSPSGNFVFPSSESDSIAKIISQAKPDLLLVALGSPKQEKWIAHYERSLCIPVCVGVGASFDFINGDLPRAPIRLQRMGLEWFWRLLHEPRRLLPRYVLSNSYFVYRLLLQVLQGHGTRSPGRHNRR